jgi:hypothetical protein
MGYYSDVRILIEEKDFDDLYKQATTTYGEGSLLNFLDVKQRRQVTDENNNTFKYVYFGWNCIKFHFAEADFIENFVLMLEEYHIVRIGEELDDIVEYHNLNKSNVDCIQIIRGFEDPADMPNEAQRDDQ